MKTKEEQIKLTAIRVPRSAHCRFIAGNISAHSKLKQRGQGTVEYALLLALLAGTSLGIIRGLNTTLAQGFLKLNAELEKSLVTGSFQQGGQNIHQVSWIK